MPVVRLTSCALCLAALFGSAAAWAVPSLSIAQSYTPPLYPRGGTIEVTVSIDAALDGETANSLGFQQTAPRGWQFDSIVSTTNPLMITPPQGDIDLLEFAFQGKVETYPQTVVFTLRAPAFATSELPLAASAIGVFDTSGLINGDETITLEPDPDNAWASADTNRDGVVDLTEVLRIVQLYNSADGFHCDDTTEDGYAPGPGDRTCVAHTSDYAGTDWRIALSELLRAIQWFRLGAYAPCDSSEDGFCPAPP